jgi:Tripartite tricarboxylate transporter TctB family
MNKAWTDIIVAVGMIALGVTGYIGSLGLTTNAFEPIGPAPGPRAIGVILVVLALTVIARAVRRLAVSGPAVAQDAPESTARRHIGKPWLAVATVALSVVYIGVMNAGLMGYRWSTVVYMFVLGAMLVGFRLRVLPAMAGIALVMGIGSHLIFTRLLFVDLP